MIKESILGNGLLIHHFFWENFLRGIVKNFFNFLWDFFGALFSKNFNLYLLFWVMNEWFRYSNDDDVRRIAGLEWRRFSKKYGTRMTTILKELRDSNDDDSQRNTGLEWRRFSKKYGTRMVFLSMNSYSWKVKNRHLKVKFNLLC